MKNSNYVFFKSLWRFGDGVESMIKKKKKWVKLNLTISTHQSQQSQTHCHYNPPKPAKPPKPTITNLKISTIFTYSLNHKQAPRNHKPGNDQQQPPRNPKISTKFTYPPNHKPRNDQETTTQVQQRLIFDWKRWEQ